MNPAPTQAVSSDAAEQLVRDAVHYVLHDVPEAHRRYVDALGSERIAMHIGEEHFTLRDGEVCAADPDAATALRISVRVLHDLITGRLALTEAVTSRSMTITGPTRSIAAVDRALQLLMHGVVRSPRAPELMQRLDRLADRDGRSPTNHSQPHLPPQSKEAS